MNNLLYDAVKNHTQIEFTYAGKLRTVEPYVYGSLNSDINAFHAKENGKDKLFHESKMSNLTALHTTFASIVQPVSENKKSIKSIWKKIYIIG